MLQHEKAMLPKFSKCLLRLLAPVGSRWHRSNVKSANKCSSHRPESWISFLFPTHRLMVFSLCGRVQDDFPCVYTRVCVHITVYIFKCISLWFSSPRRTLVPNSSLASIAQTAVPSIPLGLLSLDACMCRL